MKRLLSLVLAVIMVLSMVPAVSFAEEFDTENFKGLVLTATAEDVSVKLYEGVAEDATLMTPVYTEGTTWYYEVVAGGKYHYVAKSASGNKYYNIRKNIYISEEEANTKLVLDVTPHVRSTAGWDTYEQVKGYSDEAMAAAFPSSPELWPQYADLFNTPALTNPRNPHMQTTQTELMNYIENLNDDEDDMYVFVLGQSGGRNASEYFDIPVVFFSRTDLSGAKTWEEAAELVRENGKLTFMYQAQIHGKETGGGEAALAMLKHLDGNYGAGLLDNMNICVIPRLNTWGAYRSDRSVYTTEEIDPNRDYLKLESSEVQLTVKLHSLLEPELFYDAHECFLHPEYDRLDMHDVWSSVNFLPFTTPEFKQTALTLADKIFTRAEENNLTYGWYSSSVNGYNTVMGTTNLHARGSLVFLTETQGIMGGNQQLERRIMSHVSAVTGVLDYVNGNTAAVQKVVDDQRADIIERGKTYEDSDVIVLETGYNVYPERNINGKQVDTCSGEITDTVFTGKTYDVVKKSRPAPTAYVIPAGESWTDAVIDKLDKHGIAYTLLPAGAQIPLQQYTGTTTTATLTAEQPVTFPKGAYVMTMAQGDAYILGILMEPDVKDVKAYDGTLAQQGLIVATGGKFPIYRYIRDLNEQDFIDYTVTEVILKQTTVYVDPTNGLDTNDGLTEAAPVKTMEAAYAALEGADLGTIVLLGTLSYTQSTYFPTCTIPVTITSKTGAEGITSVEGLYFDGITTLEHLTLTRAAATHRYISTNGHDLTIGEGVVCKDQSTAGDYRFCLTLQYGEGSNGNATMTVKSGSWRNIFVGGYSKANTGNTKLIMTGGAVSNLLGPTYSGTLTGDTTIQISGGTIQCLEMGADTTGKVVGELDVNLTGGTIKKLRVPSGRPVEGGVTLTLDGAVVNDLEAKTGAINKKVMVLRSGTYTELPTDFHEVRVEIPQGKTLTLNGCAVTADSVSSAGTLCFSGAGSLTATAVTGSLNCDVTGTVVADHAYVTAPADSKITFPPADQIVGENGVWKYSESADPNAFDTVNFKGLVLTTSVDGITVELYKNFSTSESNLLTPVHVDGRDSYYEVTAGSRYYCISKPTTGSGRYITHKTIYISPQEATQKNVMDVTPGVRTTTGWDTPYAVNSFTDEVLANARPSDPSLWPQYSEIFTTPAFQPGRNDHRQTTQSEMEAFLAGLDDPDDNIYVYTLGQTAVKSFNIPIVIITTADLSGCETWEEAAKLIRADSEKNGKVTVHYQAQIHGNEPASGEAAMGMIKRLDGQYGKTVLDKLNIYVIPRLNPYGAYKSNRSTWIDSSTSTDPNRDFLHLYTAEVQARMRAFNAFDPEIVFDNHEYQFALTSTTTHRTDMMFCCHPLPMFTQAYQEMAIDITYASFAQLKADNLSYSWYDSGSGGGMGGLGGNTGSSNTAARATFHILMETMGNNFGLNMYERRVASHASAVTGILNYLHDNAADVKAVIKAERDRIIEDGKTYREDDPFVLQCTSVDDPEHYIEGEKISLITGEKTPYTIPAKRITNITRSRIAPTAYVIPANLSNIDYILNLMDMQGIAYSYIPEGATLPLQQYVGTVESADLAAERTVTFPKGAYVFTMAQVDAQILGMYMEVDVNYTASQQGSLAQQELILPVNGVFPIYRYCHDLNKDDFVDYTIEEVAAKDVTVYLDNTNGLDTNDGLTEATAVKTLEQAYALVNAALRDGGNDSNGTIVVLGVYELGSASYQFPASDFPVTLLGKTTEDGFSFTGGTGDAHVDRAIGLHGDTTFRHIKLHVNNSYAYNHIFANGHKLVMGDNVNTTVQKTNYYFAISGGSVAYGDKVASVDVTIRSGTWKMVYVGGYYGDVEGHAKLDISNASVLYSIVSSYRGNVGSLEMRISNTKVSSFKPTDTTHGIFAGTYTSNSNYNCGKVLGDVTIVLGENVTSPGVYGTARLYGRVNGKTNIIANGVDLTKVNVQARYSGLSSSYATGYVQLQLARSVAQDVTVDPGLVLDLNGYDITGHLTVEGTLQVKDSQTDDFTVEDDVYGKITGQVSGTLVAAPGYVAVDGESFHRLEQKISGVSIRPSLAGIYYSGTWNMDEVLQGKIQSFGVAVSLEGMPGVDFMSEGSGALWTQFAPAALKNGKPMTSVMIANIFSASAENNAERGKMKIYAAPYVIFTDGTTLVAETEVGYSMYDVMKKADEQAYEANKAALEAFYLTWQDVMKDWDFQNIGK